MHAPSITLEHILSLPRYFRLCVSKQVSLAADLSCGSGAPRALSNPLFDTQTTAMRKGNSLYAVNVKFGVANEDIATTAYEIVRVDRDSGELAC